METRTAPESSQTEEVYGMHADLLLHNNVIHQKKLRETLPSKLLKSIRYFASEINWTYVY